MEQLTIPLPADVAARLRALAAERGAAVEDLAGEVLTSWSSPSDGLTEAQWAEVARRMALPDDDATDEEVEAFFAEMKRE